MWFGFKAFFCLRVSQNNFFAKKCPQGVERVPDVIDPSPNHQVTTFFFINIKINSTCDAPSDVTEHPISLSDHVAPLSVTVKRVRLAIVALALLLRCVLKLSMEHM